MSYSLHPILVDLVKVEALLGSKDTDLLQSVIKKHRKEMFNTDAALDNDFEEFESEIKREYKAFSAGDFSSVDLKAVYPEPAEEEEELDEDDKAFKKEYERLRKVDPDAADKYMKEWLLKAFEDDDEDDAEEGEDDLEGEPEQEISTGAALVHMIMGGNPDRRLGFKYGYALFHLCEYLGEMPEHDSWCAIRSRTLDWIDKFFRTAGIKPKEFNASEFLIERGPPVEIPRPDDFPAIGYLKRGEMPAILNKLDPAKIDPVLAKQSAEDQEWLGLMIDELRTWLELGVETDRDLICFYF